MRSSLYIAAIFLLLSQISFSQACGVYDLTYKVTVETDYIIKKVEFPRLELLHGYELEIKTPASYIVSPKSKNLECKTQSPITSQLHDDPNALLKFYKSNLERVPIIFYVVDKLGNPKNITIEVPWDKINIVKVDNQDFILDFNELSIE